MCSVVGLWSSYGAKMLLSHVIHGSFGADRTSVVSHDKHGFVLNDPEGTTSYQGPPPTAAEG